MPAVAERKLYYLAERARDALDRNRKLRVLGPLETAMTLRLRALWLREAAEVLRLLTREEWRRLSGLSEAIDPGTEGLLAAAQAKVNGQARDTFATAGEALTAGARAAEDTLGINLSFDVKHPDAVAYLNRRGAERVSAVNSTTRKYLQTEIRDAVAKGESYEKVARRITARYAEFGAPSPLRHIRSRAELIAVTEMGDAYVHGTLTAARSLAVRGFGVEKHWLTTGDSRVDDIICRPNEAAGWIPLEDSFASGHDGPTGHPGCRCDLQTRRTPARVAPEAPPAPPSPEATLEEWVLSPEEAWRNMRDPNTPGGRRMADALLDLPPYEGRVYRGMNVPDLEDVSDFRAGQVHSLKLHSSASKDYGVAAEYSSYDEGHPVLFVVDTKTGRDVSDIARAAGKGGMDEQEVVLQAGTRYHVKSVKEIPDGLEIHLTEL